VIDKGGFYSFVVALFFKSLLENYTFLKKSYHDLHPTILPHSELYLSTVRVLFEMCTEVKYSIINLLGCTLTKLTEQRDKVP